VTDSSRIVISAGASARIRHGAADLQRYLAIATGAVHPVVEASTAGSDGPAFALGFTGDGGVGDDLAAKALAGRPTAAEGYALRRSGDTIAILGADEAGAVYGIYGLLEEAYGCGFFLGSEIVPPGTAPLLPETLDIQRSPAFATRGLLPWYDFLSGPTAWNLPEYKLYIDRMVRTGLNFLGLHVYSTGSVNRSGGAEPFLSFSWRGVGHDGYLDTTQTARWGYQPMRTSEFAFGTDQVFAGEVFGADAAIGACGSLDAVVRAKALLGAALDYAKERGLRVCVGFEPAAIPQEILAAIPTNAKRPKRDRDGSTQQVLDLASVVAHDILKRRLDDLLDTYPQVDAIWLWQNEDAAWTIRHAGADTLPFDPAYLRAAHDYVKQRAPEVQVVVSGWGAVHERFDQLHGELPKDMPFSALNHNLGTSETDEVYGRLEGRSRWPIPWLEDDATLWQPQFHVERFRNDIERAHRFGADGMIGIHWRTRVIDHVASYFARALWEPSLSSTDFYGWYGTRLVGVEHGDAFAAKIEAIDLAHAWPGYMDEAHVGSADWSHGHSNEAGAAFNPLPTAPEVMDHFGGYADFLQELAATVPDEAAERLRYHASQAAFARHYVTSQQAALEVDQLVASAVDQHRRLTDEEFTESCRLLATIYDAVRAAIGAFHAEISTTAELGVLASLSLKYAQRAIWQRYDAVRQVAADPDAMPVPDLAPRSPVQRVFVPVPPERIDQNGTLIEAIVQAPDVAAVSVVSEGLDGSGWRETALTRRGRGVWTGTLRAGCAIRYWIEARTADGGILRAPGVDSQVYSAVVIEGT